MVNPLNPQQIDSALHGLPGWEAGATGLTRIFEFANFREALAFMVRVGFEAEELNHHPSWSNVYNRVTVQLATHDAGGQVTDKDVELAQRIQKVVERE